jgi:selenium metabolism protein YedF
MTEIIDLSNLSCPLPVLRTKETLETHPGDRFTVIVDNEASRDNVRRFAESQGCTVAVAEQEGCYYLTVQRPVGPRPTPGAETLTGAPGVAPAARQKVVVFASDLMGSGDPQLGGILAQAFLKTLVQVNELPQKLIFYNRGVFLTLQGSEVLAALQQMERAGVEILVCGTCLDFYHLKEQLAVGQVSNMFSILEAMMQADRIIQP